jgi:hypothetical protein
MGRNNGLLAWFEAVEHRLFLPNGRSHVGTGPSVTLFEAKRQLSRS